MRAFLTLMILAAALSTAHAQTAPPFKAEQHVYVVPSGWTHRLLGQPGFQAIEEAAAARKHPFYVVVGEPGAIPEINALATAWTGQGLNNAEASILTVTLGKRMDFRLLAGSRWESELGLKGDAHKPFTDLLLDSVKSKRKDVVGGIQRLMAAMDTYIEEEPGRRARAAAEAERAAAIQKVTDARTKLGGQIARLTGLLAEREYAPANVTEERALLDRAQKVLDTSGEDVSAMEAMATAMFPLVNKLDAEVGKKKDAAMTAALVRGIMIFVLLLLAVMALRALARRKSRLVELRTRYTEKLNRYLGMVDTGMGRYVDFRDRDGLTRLQERLKDAPETNETKKLLQEVTTLVDDIFVALKALQSHLLNKVRPLAAKGGFFNFKPIIEANALIDSTFTFDTGVIEEKDLFSPETKHVQVDAFNFSREQAAKYEKAVAGWQRLKAALEAQERPVATTLPIEDFTTWAGALPKTIGPAWYADHPLAGANAVSTYQRLDALRVNDPISYVAALAETEKKGAEVGERVARLVKAAAEAEEPAQTVFPRDSVVADEQNPEVTLQTAARERTKLKIMLGAATSTVEDVEAQAEKVAKLKKTAQGQAAELVTAVASAVEDIGRVSLMLAEAAAAGQKAADRVIEAAKHHANVPSLSSGQALVKEAAGAADKAAKALSARRHLDAAHLAREALGQAMRARDVFNAVMNQCADLDAARERYQRRVKEMPQVREQIADRITSKYKGRRQVGAFSEDRFHDHHDCPVDYVLLTMEADRERRAWEVAEEEARQEHQREIARERASSYGHSHYGYDNGYRSGGHTSRRDDDTSSRQSYTSTSRDEDRSSGGGCDLSGGGGGGSNDTSSGGGCDL